MAGRRGVFSRTMFLGLEPQTIWLWGEWEESLVGVPLHGYDGGQGARDGGWGPRVGLGGLRLGTRRSPALPPPIRTSAVLPRDPAQATSAAAAASTFCSCQTEWPDGP